MSNLVILSPETVISRQTTDPTITLNRRSGLISINKTGRSLILENKLENGLIFVHNNEEKTTYLANPNKHKCGSYVFRDKGEYSVYTHKELVRNIANLNLISDEENLFRFRLGSIQETGFPLLKIPTKQLKKD